MTGGTASSSSPPARLVRDISDSAALCAFATAVVAAAAAVVWALGLGDELRSSLGFGFAGVPRTPGEALRIALHNGRFAVGILACALAAPRLPHVAQTLIELALAGLLVVNAGIVGVTVGAYGSRGLLAVAPHVPIEFAALSLAGGAYLSASRRPLALRALGGVTLRCGLLLVAAALLETYVQLAASP